MDKAAAKNTTRMGGDFLKRHLPGLDQRPTSQLLRWHQRPNRGASLYKCFVSTDDIGGKMAAVIAAFKGTEGCARHPTHRAGLVGIFRRVFN
jgi:hypothetical protein